MWVREFHNEHYTNLGERDRENQRTRMRLVKSACVIERKRNRKRGSSSCSSSYKNSPYLILLKTLVSMLLLWHNTTDREELYPNKKPMVAELGQQTVELSTFVTHATNDKSSDMLAPLIKSRLVLRRLKMQTLPFLYQLKRLS